MVDCMDRFGYTDIIVISVWYILFVKVGFQFTISLLLIKSHLQS